jgi:peroxiredoxin
VLCVGNLALNFAVIRKVRAHDERLAGLPRHRPLLQRLPPGTKVPEFTAVTVTGETRSLAEMTGSRSLVGFFSPGCPTCHDQLPAFTKFARRIPGGAGQVLAVVAGADERATEFAAQVSGGASVVIEPWQGPVCTAFSVPGLPSFYLIAADGRIEASGMAMANIAEPAPAR